MQCKFLEHGVAIGYDHVVKPCCEWIQDSEWDKQNHISQVNLTTWHQSTQVLQIRDQLSQGNWPKACERCAQIEHSGRQDSMRGNGLSAYRDFQDNDITLEIRPGSICNFACQTCWPAASSKVAQYHHQAGIIDIKSVDSSKIDNFDFLLPVVDRIRNVVLLGGEPFYDPSCKKFLSWAQHNLQANITMFTNGSHVDWSWVDSYSGKIIMVFSIDAVGPPAEYIRFGTDWPVVFDNFCQAQKHPKIDLRVNITASVFNYPYIESVIDLLIPRWPTVVSFGQPQHSPHLCEPAVPPAHRKIVVEQLIDTISKIWAADIEIGQQHNAANALQSIVNNLLSDNFNPKLHQTLKKFVADMDRVKHVQVQDYCDWLSRVCAS